MTTTKVLALVLGSVWFFPVSCTSSLYAGTHMIARLDAREVARGDRVHPGFSVVLEPGENGAAFRSLPLSELPRLREASKGYSILMSKPSGSIDVDESTHVSYRVLENRGPDQLLEVETKDDDSTVWSRYQATATDVTPVASRMFHSGYMFGALPYAFGAALLLYGIGRFLRRRLP